MNAGKRQEIPPERDRLLTTRDAATFLKVSEASIRRWTDSGLLPAHRVGRRRADLREQYFAALRNDGVDAAEAVGSGLLMIYPEVAGSAAEQVVRFEQLLTAATRKRPGPIRLLADVLADIDAVGSVAEHLIVEQRVGPLFKRFPVVTICAYDVRAFDGVTVIEALKLHSDIFGPQVGYWLN